MKRIGSIGSILIVLLLVLTAIPIGSTASADSSIDLMVSSVGINSSVVYDNDYVLIQATVRNLGDSDAEIGIPVSFYADGKLIQSVKIPQALPAGSRITVNATAYWTPGFGSHRITAAVNDQKTTVESDYSNNLMRSRIVVLDETNPTPVTPLDNVVTEIIFSDDSLLLKNSGGGEIPHTMAANVSVTENTNVTINREGVYSLSGSCSEGSVNVDVDKTLYPDAVVELELKGLDLASSVRSPIYVAAIGDECVILAKKNTINTLSDGENYENADLDSGTIYSKDDLKIKGKGTLNVYGNSHFGISSSNDVKIWNSTLTVHSKGVGIKGKDSVKIGNPKDMETSGAYDDLSLTVVTEGGDGIRSTNTEDETKGSITICGGKINIDSHTDALYAVRDITVKGGEIDLHTYTGAGTSSNSSGNQRPGMGNDSNPNHNVDISAKGIKCGSSDPEIEGSINIEGGAVSIDSFDDGIHASGTVTMAGGAVTIKTGDDGIHSDTVLNVKDGAVINILQSYEGLEAYDLEISGGNITVNSSDDGLNAAGGNDQSGGPWRPGGMSSSTGILNISGGYIFVRAEGDGIDSNGNIDITGGTVIVCGPTKGGNGIFDRGDGNYRFNISNATVLGIGTSDMFVTPIVSAYLKKSLQLQAGNLLSIADSNGNVLSVLKVPSDINMNGVIFYTSPEYNASTYKLYRGGSYSGLLNDNGYGTGGKINNATQL